MRGSIDAALRIPLQQPLRQRVAVHSAGLAGAQQRRAASATDPDVQLFRKSHHGAAILAFQENLPMENRSGLVVGAMVTHADGLGERAAALAMLDTVPSTHPKTVAADKAYDTRDFIAACRQRRITPRVAAKDTRYGGSAIDGSTMRHPGYAVSQTIRKRIEEQFGWGKTVGRIRQTVYRGLRRVDQHLSSR